MIERSQSNNFELFAFMWAIALLFHIIQAYSKQIIVYHSLLHILFFASAIFLLFFHRQLAAFLSLSFLTIIVNWQSFPQNVSNHAFMEFLLSISFVTTLIIAVYRKNKNKDSYLKQYFYTSASATGRWFLVIMYFFGVFHKLNTDWFNPEVSCAVALWKSFFWSLPTSIENSSFFHYSAIYGTLIIETLIIVIFFAVPKWSKAAVISGILFHGMIGMNAYAHYWNFSTLSFALHFLFLPEDTAKKWRASDIYLFIKRKTGFVFLKLLIALIFMHFMHLVLARDYTLIYAVWPIIVTMIVAFVMAFADYSQKTRSDAIALIIKIPKHSMFFAGLFVFNCINPYIGLKTESALAMYSNLYTEHGETNHLFFDDPPYLFSYQEEISGGSDAGESNNFMSYLSSKLIPAKRVDGSRPKRCTH